jgi:hypothetical protein
MIAPMEPSGRWWLVDGHEVDVNAPEGTYPLNLRAAVLCHRDAVDDADKDLAALLEWTVEAHPLWTGTCPACGPECAANATARPLATEWLARQARLVYERVSARLGAIEARRRA